MAIRHCVNEKDLGDAVRVDDAGVMKRCSGYE